MIILSISCLDNKNYPLSIFYNSAHHQIEFLHFLKIKLTKKQKKFIFCFVKYKNKEKFP